MKEREANAEIYAKVDEYCKKHPRLDGRAHTEAQRKEIAQQLIEEAKKAGLDFDPRKCRLTHGIRGYVEPKNKDVPMNTGQVKGVRIG